MAPVDAAQASVALAARIRFGKGCGHPAQLSYGDGFAYALAKMPAGLLPLVGEGFAVTDLVPALATSDAP